MILKTFICFNVYFLRHSISVPLQKIASKSDFRKIGCKDRNRGMTLLSLETD